MLWFIADPSPPTIIWNQTLAYPTALAYFSPDSSLIASVGQHDRHVKIWRRLSYEVDGTRFDVCYLPHPTTVTNLHWRKPWHLEQNLDSLLYTFGSDNHVRAWTTFDPHALAVLQQVGDIDMNASIQPRRLSASSISTQRYAFILDSRDFSTATEKAVQGSNGKNADHALEHLIEIANRTPEVCVVLDGLGHMSIWGLENAGYKSRVPPSVFHISHVDGMNVSVPQSNDLMENYVQFCVFAGGSSPSSLSLLLHSFAGDIGWYDSQITRLFDTATRQDRVRLVSSLAGVEAPIQKLLRNVVGNVIMSIADDRNASVWQHGDQASAALLRRCTFDVGSDIIDAVILSRGRYAAVLSARGLELWDIRQSGAKRIALRELEGHCLPERISQSRIASSRALTSRVIVGVFSDHRVEAWQMLLPANDTGGSNGYHELIRHLGDVHFQAQNRHKSLLSICDNMSTNPQPVGPPGTSALSFAAALAKDGTLEMVSSQEELDSTKPHLVSGALIEINIRAPQRISANGQGKVVVVNEDSTRLSIWNVKTGSTEYQHELDGTDALKTFAWAVTPQGLALLAICFDYHIVILGQVRYCYPHCDPAWVDLRHIRVRDYTTHSVGDVCWLGNGDLVVGSGIQLFVFEPYAISYHNEKAKPLRSLPANASTADTFTIMSMLNSLLPVFHPTFVSLLTYSDGLQAARTVFSHLRRLLKYFSDGDELSSFLDMDLEIFADSIQSHPPNDLSYYDTTGDVNGDVVPTMICDISKPLCEDLQKYRLWQITKDEQSQLIKQIEVATEVEKEERSIDANAQRYLQALYSSGGEGVSWTAIAFAALSTSQEVLVDLVTRFYGGKLSWEAARKSGIFSWLSDTEAICQQMENVGRTEFTKGDERNPIDCSLYYLALHKKTVLQGLWRMTIGVREKENTMKLLANNFAEARWKASALKNAYALLSRRRFHYAAAFFLLGDSLWDAVNVCAHHLKDLQLAIAIARVYKGENQSLVLSRLFEQALLPAAIRSEQGRWMASWAYSTMLDRKDFAIQVLVQPVHRIGGTSLIEGDMREQGMLGSLGYAANDPLLSLLYTQLRAQLVKQNNWRRNIVSAKDEWGFVMRCVRQYLRMGCDVLALSLVRDWEFVPHNPEKQITVDPRTLSPTVQRRKTFYDLEKEEDEENKPQAIIQVEKKNPPPTQFVEPSANSLFDSFGL